jgi:hypothetical protein
MRAEISYDLVMEDDMSFSEGTYQLPEHEWQVIIVSKDDVLEPIIVPSVWDSGVTGLFVKYPEHRRLNELAIEELLSTYLGVDEWIRVRGPDSMQIR